MHAHVYVRVMCAYSTRGFSSVASSVLPLIDLRLRFLHGRLISLQQWNEYCRGLAVRCGNRFLIRIVVAVGRSSLLITIVELDGMDSCRSLRNVPE